MCQPGAVSISTRPAEAKGAGRAHGAAVRVSDGGKPGLAGVAFHWEVVALRDLKSNVFKTNISCHTDAGCDELS